jgi:hypothetical protein
VPPVNDEFILRDIMDRVTRIDDKQDEILAAQSLLKEQIITDVTTLGAQVNANTRKLRSLLPAVEDLSNKYKMISWMAAGVALAAVFLGVPDRIKALLNM